MKQLTIVTKKGKLLADSLGTKDRLDREICTMICRVAVRYRKLTQFSVSTEQELSTILSILRKCNDLQENLAILAGCLSKCPVARLIFKDGDVFMAVGESRITIPRDIRRSKLKEVGG